MAQSTRTFRIFVSSTFSDLKIERNALQEQVFPRLRELAAQHGCRFQPVDLRWGVSDEASLDQQAMNICLGEIGRCQQTSPRPNFIVLLGDRYGWCPPPSQIPADEFEKIRRVVKTDEEQNLLKEWYCLDENAVPKEWRLKPRLRGGQYEKYDDWQPVEARLHAILAEAVVKLDLTPERQLPYIASATEQEIASGALRVKEAPEHVFGFFRSLDDLPKQFKASEFMTLVEARLKHNFPSGLSKASQELVDEILECGANSFAKDLSSRIKKVLEHTPSATPEEEVVDFVRQVLVDVAAKDFQNLDEIEWSVDDEAHKKQRDLKERLQKYVPQNIRTYSAHWTGNDIKGKLVSTDHIDQLCEDVYEALSRIILEEIEHPHSLAAAEEEIVRIQPAAALDAEGMVHLKFAEDHLKIFVGREDMLAKIANYLPDSGCRYLVIVGAGGTGKSTLVARAIQDTQKSHPNAEIVYRFIGVTPGSSDGRSLLDSLCNELSRRYGADASNIPTDYRDLVPELGKRMQLATAEKPLILFLDSLDQLSASQGARSLIWLPNELPEHVSIITTSRPGDTLMAMQAKQALEKELGGLSRQEGSDLLSQWLASVHRTLQPAQFQEVLDKFEFKDMPVKPELSPGNPLYLKLAYEEARLWPSYSAPEQLAPGVKGIIEKNMFDRLMNEGNHGEKLVSHALGYLAASRFGLAEDELLDLLSRDLQVYEWFFKKSYHLPADLLKWAIAYRRGFPAGSGKEEAPTDEKEERETLAWLKKIRNPPEKVTEFLQEVLPKADGPRLPVVLWSRLSFDLAPYLTERMVDGSLLLNFYHRELGDVSTEVFLGGDKDKPYHERLADYFRLKADPASDHTWTGQSRHGLSELPYHLTEAERFEQVYQVLTDFKFLEHKAAEVGVLTRTDESGKKVNTYTGVLQLQEDYEHALTGMPGGEGGMGDRAPLILTALETSQGLMVYCPVCNKASPIEKDMLDKKIACPQEKCKAPIKLNPFTVKREV